MAAAGEATDYLRLDPEPLAAERQGNQYIRARGTNLPVGTPFETDMQGNPLSDLAVSKIACTSQDCPGHMQTDATGNKLSSFDESLGDNALEAFISRLRKKLAGSGASIRTLRGIGYLLEAEV